MERTHTFPPASASSFWTTVAGVSMHAVVMGKERGLEREQGKSTFVLVHGLGMSARYMMPTAEWLAAAGNRVYAPDLPGFGKSGKPQAALTIPELSDALAGWMTAQHFAPPVVLIGNSLGAQVIVDFAVRYPGRLNAAVLVGPTVDPEARKVSIHVWRLLVDIVREPVGLYGLGLMDYLRAGFFRVLRTLRHALVDPVVEKLPLMRVPVLIVRGGWDPIVPQRWVENAVRLIPNGCLVTLPKAAHAVNFNAPEALVAEVLGFVEKCRVINDQKRMDSGGYG